MNLKKPSTWVGVDLPFRFTSGTYGTWLYDTLPPCPDKHKYSKYINIDQLDDDDIITESPTACYFDTSYGKNVFYRDQQDCVLWCLDSEGVYLHGDKSYVAHSLSEFLWRIDVENKCWYKRIKDYELVLKDWKPIKDYEKYIDHYHQLYKRTRQYILDNTTGATTKNIDYYLPYYINFRSLKDMNENFTVRTEYISKFDGLQEKGKLEIYRDILGIGLGEETENVLLKK